MRVASLLAITAALGVPLPGALRERPACARLPCEGPTQAEIDAQSKRLRKATKRAEQQRTERTMRNLAGDKYADASIEDELTAAGIHLVDSPADHRGEVPATKMGKLGPFTFRRAWYYWVVGGATVPKAIALSMWHAPIGRTDVRVQGHCECPEPSDDVTGYHIDSAAGLRLFVDTVRRHGLDIQDGEG